MYAAPTNRELCCHAVQLANTLYFSVWACRRHVLKFSLQPRWNGVDGHALPGCTGSCTCRHDACLISEELRFPRFRPAELWLISCRGPETLRTTRDCATLPRPAARSVRWHQAWRMSPAPRAVEVCYSATLLLLEPRAGACPQARSAVDAGAAPLPPLVPCSESLFGKEHTREVTAMYQEACWLASIFGRIALPHKGRPA